MQNPATPPLDSSRNERRGPFASIRSIRWHLLGAVNLTLGSLVLVLMFLDYRREMLDVVRDKRASLNDEAVAIHGAVIHLQQSHGLADVQAYLDSVSTARNSSADHQIVAQLGDFVVSSRGDQQTSGELQRVVQNSVRDNDQPIIVGTHSQDGVRIFVGEPFSPVRRSVRAEFLREIQWLCVLGIVATVIVNLVVVRLVVRPLERFAALVDRIAEGDYSVRANSFKSSELDGLATAFNSMSSNLLALEQHRRQQMERARRIQSHLLPDRFDIPGVTLELRFQPAEGVAGDYFDVLALPDGNWLLCVADVTGHGVPAALGAAMLKMMLVSAAEQLSSPAEILAFANQRFAAAFLPGYFASVFLAKWDPRQRTLECSNAGHEPALLCTTSGVERIGATGLFLGVDSEETWETVSLPINDGDRLLLSTDGVAETRDPQNQLFGRDRLERIVDTTRGMTLHDSIGHIEAELILHGAQKPPADDMTLVCVEFTDFLVESFGQGCESSHLFRQHNA